MAWRTNLLSKLLILFYSGYHGGRFDFDVSIFQRVVFREDGKFKEDEDSNLPVALRSTLLSNCLKLLAVSKCNRQQSKATM